MKRLALLVVAIAACRPDLGPGESLVSSRRLLAVRADPAETLPGAQATYTALVASPDGTVQDAAIAWSFCSAPKPLTNDNIVSDACLGGSNLVPAGAGAEIVAPTPKDACVLFGPDTPPGGFRPRDPDVTGGYYQPLRADLAGTPAAFVLARVTCHLPNAPPEVVTAFAEAYAPNANPKLEPLAASIDGRSVPLSAIPAGARVSFRASWPASSAETYAYYDAKSQALSTKREALRVSWYATAGSFDAEVTGRDESDVATYADDGWTAPERASTVHLWIVLRDSRGGSEFAAYDVEVR